MKRFAWILLACAVGAWAQPDPEDPSLRNPRTGAVSLELGANSLSSLLGLKYTHFATPQLAVDVGLGLSATGLRPGIYARYLLTNGKFTPFVYGGFKYGLGSNGQSTKLEDPETEEELEIEIEASPFIDAGVGLDFLAHNGFYLTAGLGWSQLLGGENYEFTGFQAPSQEAEDLAKAVFGSGLALSLSVGYAF